MATESKWKTERAAQAFLQGIRGAIPGANLQFEVIGKITDLWLEKPVRALDLGCGDGVLGRFLLARYPGSAGLFLDFSEPMLKAARHATEAMEGVEVKQADFSSPSWVGAARPRGPFDIVISGFAIHHQPDQRKREIYDEVYDLLCPGGVFLNLEHVASPSPASEKLFDEFFVDHLYQFHSQTKSEVKRSEVAAGYYTREDKKENILAPVERQTSWLREIGFQDVDCFFKTFELALFGGRKPRRN